MTLGYPEHDRWAMLVRSVAPHMVPKAPIGKIGQIRHPEYTYMEKDWQKWRLVMEGGEAFNEQYIKKFSEREGNDDFTNRKDITPTPAFAKGALLEIKNSIFQRTADITRAGGPKTYTDACAGNIGGVDLQNASMNWYLGHYVIEELLSMKKIGVYVDAPKYGLTKADKGDKHPYLYSYRTEDILSWDWGKNRELLAVLMRDYNFVKDEETGLPKEEEVTYRLLRKVDGGVKIEIIDEHDKVMQQTIIPIKNIPLVIFEINHSLLKDIANHQIALTNLESSDLSFLYKAAFPFYTEQVADTNFNNIKAAQEQSQAEYKRTNGDGDVETSVDPYCPTYPSTPKAQAEIGASQGRQYPKGLERPGFINPSVEPVKASMQKQEELKSDIRLLVQLALANLQPKNASEESKKMDDRGLEAGLSYIGLEIERGEREIADIWRQYEGESKSTTITYPKRWSLKSEKEIKEEVESLEKSREAVPSNTYRREITKQIANVQLAAKVSEETLATIIKEIDSAPAIPIDVLEDQKAGLVSDATASALRGYKPEELEQARADKAKRAALTLKAQTSPNDPAARGAPVPNDPAARGAPDLSNNPDASKEEKIDKPQRGPEKE